MLRVSRPTPGRRAGKLESLPPLETFKSQVRALTSGQVPTRTSTLRLSPDAQPLQVPEALETHAALRYFDPTTRSIAADATVIGRVENGAVVPVTGGASQPAPASP